MDEQLFRATVRGAVPFEVVEVRVTALEEHADLGVLVQAVTDGGRQVELLPLWPARLFHALRAGDHGLALFARGEAQSGYFLSGAVVRGVLPAGYDAEVDQLDAWGDLRLDAGGEINLQQGEKGAARVDDAVEITVTISDAAQLQKLAAALLTTGAFLPSGSPPVPASAVTPMTFAGRISEGSATVKIGG